MGHDEQKTTNEHDSHNNNAIEIPLYSRPVQRQRWGEAQAEPHTNWGDTFFDLFYVAAAYNLGTLIRAEPTSRGLLYFTGCFFPICSLWIQKMYFDARFSYHIDVFHRFYEFAILVVLATAVLHIRTVSVLENSVDNVDMFTFALSLGIANVLAIGRALEIMLFVDGQDAAKVAARRDMMWFLATLIMQVAAAIVAGIEHFGNGDSDNKSPSDISSKYEDDHRRSMAATETDAYGDTDEVNDIPIWLCFGGGMVNVVGMAVMVLTLPGGGEHRKITVPMNITFGIHRWGEWTMLMLGESVLSMLIVDVTESSGYYKTFFSGIFSITLLEFLHFRSQPHEADGHALRRSKEAGVAFTVLMQVYSASLVILGTSYKMLLYEYIYEESESSSHRKLFGFMSRFLAGAEAPKFALDDRRQRIAHFFCISMALVWFCSDAMILTHRGLKDNMGRCKCSHTGGTRYMAVALTLLRVGLIAFMATLSQYVTQPELLAFIGLLGILAQVTLRVIGTSLFGPTFEHDLDENESSHIWPNVTRPQVASSDKELSSEELIKT